MRTYMSTPQKEFKVFLENAHCLRVAKSFCNENEFHEIIEPMELGFDSNVEDNEEALNKLCLRSLRNHDKMTLSFEAYYLSPQIKNILYGGISDNYDYDGTPFTTIDEVLYKGEWTWDMTCIRNCHIICHSYLPWNNNITVNVTSDCDGQLTQGTHYELKYNKVLCYWYVQFLDRWNNNLSLEQNITISHSGTRRNGEMYKPNQCDHADPFVFALESYGSRCADNQKKSVMLFRDATATPFIPTLASKSNEKATAFGVTMTGFLEKRDIFDL